MSADPAVETFPGAVPGRYWHRLEDGRTQTVVVDRSVQHSAMPQSPNMILMHVYPSGMLVTPVQAAAARDGHERAALERAEAGRDARDRARRLDGASLQEARGAPAVSTDTMRMPCARHALSTTRFY